MYPSPRANRGLLTNHRRRAFLVTLASLPRVDGRAETRKAKGIAGLTRPW